MLEPVIARYRERGLDLYFRGDAAFAKPELYELLEAEGINYAIRLPANGILQERIGHLLTRPVGRPPKKPRLFFASFSYQAQSWAKPRRVVAKVEWHQAELYPRVGFVVTNLNRPAERVSKFYNGRGTAEQWIREGKYALHWTRLSCRSFQDNAVRLQLFALAYNLANFLRSLALPSDVAHWSLTHVAREAGQDRRPDRPAWPLRRLPARRGRRAKVALRRDPASDRPAARIACAGDMMGGKQVMAAVEERAMRRSPAEPAATGCRRPWGRFRSVPTLKIASRRLSC